MLWDVLDYDIAEAAGLCECGAPLDDHPPIPAPRLWSYGRPCAKSALDRGIGWDGSPAPEHTARNKSRWSALGSVATAPIPPPPQLTKRQAEALRVLLSHGGRQFLAARELGITSASMSLMVKRLRGRGALSPP